MTVLNFKYNNYKPGQLYINVSTLNKHISVVLYSLQYKWSSISFQYFCLSFMIKSNDIHYKLLLLK